LIAAVILSVVMSRLRVAVRISIIASALYAPSTSRAQPTAQFTGIYTIEREMRERWMNARQMPLHTPHVRTVAWIAIDSLASDSARNRTLFGRAGGGPSSGQPIRLSLRPDGHVLRIDADASPKTRLWDVTMVFRPPRLQYGARWLDTLAYGAELMGSAQSLAGVRVYTLVGDTILGARRLWVIRDSASVRYTDRTPIPERRLAAPATVERNVAGVIVGHSLYDPEIGLFRVRADTTVLRGEARLRYPDGRTFTSPTRFERMQRWSLYDRQELAGRVAQLRAQADSNSFSIVGVPRNPLEERIAAGHAPTIDSLFTAWQLSRDPDQRIGIKRLLMAWSRDSATRARIEAVRGVEGDTLYLVEDTRYYLPRYRLTMTDVDLLLPLMRDPGLAFRYGVSRDIPYERVIETLVREPPATQPDTGKWPCEPTACRRIAAEYARTTEPRLKSTALTVLTLMDPRRWRDTFVAHARAGDKVLQLALPLVIGQAVPVPVTPPPSADWPSVPPRNADWTMWRDWIRGPVSQLPAAPLGGRGAGSPPPPAWLRWRGNPTAIRLEQAATGRDIVAELRALFPNGPDDTARVVIGNILAGLNALPWTIDSVVVVLRNGTPLRREFAADMLGSGASLFRFEPANVATADTIQEQFLTGVTNRRDPWRSLEDLKYNRPARGFRNPPSDARGSLPVYYATDDLTPAVRARWSDRIRTMSQAEWRARPSREGGELWAISRVERAGPIAHMRVMVSGRNTRAANQGPNAWYSWTHYYLMKIGGEWVIVRLYSGVT
jgi:hypothetical protein